MTFPLSNSQTALAGTNSLEQHKLCLFSKRFNGVLAADQNFTIGTDLQLSSFWKPFSRPIFFQRAVKLWIKCDFPGVSQLFGTRTVGSHPAQLKQVSNRVGIGLGSRIVPQT